jgi:Ras-related protein Rab-4B
MSYDYLFKLLLIGQENSGKTSFSTRICSNKYSHEYEPTIGVEYSSTIINILNKLKIKCQLWDTAGKKIYNPIIEQYYKGVAGIFIFVDISHEKYHKHLNYWVNHFKTHNVGNPVVMVVSNKVDKVDSCEKIAVDNGFLYMQMSVKNDVNVEESLQKMCKTIFENYDSVENNTGIRLPPFIELKKNKIEERSCCF